MARQRRRIAVLTVAVTLSCGISTAQTLGWPISCGDGRVDDVLDHFNQPWTICCTAGAPQPTLAVEQGCSGEALAVGYDLTAPVNGQSWVVIQRFFPAPRNLSAFTHVRLAFRGTVESHETVDVKLRNGDNGIFTASLRSMTDLPVWRVVYIDFREFVRTGGTLDLTNITGLEIGIARCDECEVWDNPGVGGASEHAGTLHLDEFSIVNLKPGGAHRVIQTALETATPLPALRTAAAAALLARAVQSGPGQHMLPAWFAEATPNLNTYVQAEALLVFTYEFERTGNIAYRDAAIDLAAKLIALQIPDGRTQAGAWYTAHTPAGGQLHPPTRAIPAGAACTGDEMMIADPAEGGTLSAKNIDACEWVGNVGWVLVAFGKLRRAGFYPEPALLQTSIDRAANWVLRQPTERAHPSFPGLVSLGIEGNLSGYFGLVAAGKRTEAAPLAAAIFQFGWDPIQRRMKPGARPEDAATAIDVSGSWGAVFLRATGRMQEALDSMGYTASILRAASYDGSVRGYGDIAGPYTPAVEFAAQAIAAGMRDANFVMQQLAAQQLPAGGAFAGAFPGAPDHWYGGPLNPWVTTMPGVSPTAWMYLAACCDPLMALVPFADAMLSSATPIRAVHVTELHTRIDALRRRFGLAGFPWTPVQTGTAVAAQHIIELRSALTQAYGAAAATPTLPLWTDPTVVPRQTTIKAVHVTEIRAAVVALE
jgi:hypothetical protein